MALELKNESYDALATWRRTQVWGLSLNALRKVFMLGIKQQNLRRFRRITRLHHPQFALSQRRGIDSVLHLRFGSLSATRITPILFIARQ